MGWFASNLITIITLAPLLSLQSADWQEINLIIAAYLTLTIDWDRKKNAGLGICSVTLCSFALCSFAIVALFKRLKTANRSLHSQMLLNLQWMPNGEWMSAFFQERMQEVAILPKYIFAIIFSLCFHTKTWVIFSLGGFGFLKFWIFILFFKKIFSSPTLHKNRAVSRIAYVQWICGENSCWENKLPSHVV